MSAPKRHGGAEPGPDARVAVKLPKGYWPADKALAILDKTLSFRLEEDLSTLTPAERRVVDELVAVGYLLGELNEEQRHHQAFRARDELRELHEQLGRPARTQDLLDLYRLFLGPIATTLENELEPFLPVDGFTEGKAFYPWGIDRDELDAFLEAHPERQADILGVHTIVRRSTPRHLKRDLLTLRRYPPAGGPPPGPRALLSRTRGQSNPRGLLRRAVLGRLAGAAAGSVQPALGGRGRHRTRGCRCRSVPATARSGSPDRRQRGR